ncbi:hypothetical protein [Mycobacteroides abscessus]|nr:hypothetical protein [Mycobacteroides abscessus]MBE5399223.1 hypothetical protein [Mycobacteroides abscessus]MBE5413305.1 hypothetical protein [Mycobacteroides abscessus]MBE5418373.1 hypothetical protein [Mycobacteroides abscessus]MBE5424747.1 hypothetical protein [Mycobacteroides abscessus]MBE5477572.1 hypothetical protein [Mycobacteroides abscessus]
MAGRHRHFGVAHARLAWPRPHMTRPSIDPVSAGADGWSRPWKSGSVLANSGGEDTFQYVELHIDYLIELVNAPLLPLIRGPFVEKPAAFERPSSVVHLQEDRTTPTPTSTSSSTHAPSIRAWAAVSPEMMKPGVHAVPAWSKRLHHKTSGNALDAA